jgi:hypothetical protein
MAVIVVARIITITTLAEKITDHYVYLSSEAQVIGEMSAFLNTLH